MKKKVVKKKTVKKKKVSSKKNNKTLNTLGLVKDQDIAIDFATKFYKIVGTPIKSIALFGSSTKKTAVAGSDIDIIIIVDDVSVKWDLELTAWYREELGKIIQSNPYKKELHINTVKLSTWWEDVLRGDPTVINILRYGESVLDLGGFFTPLKTLLVQGKIRGTPEAIYSCLERAPRHIARSKLAEVGAVEGIYWSMIDSAHAALISAEVLPASPEYISMDLKTHFVDKGRIKQKHLDAFREVLTLYKRIEHNEVSDLKGVVLDDLQQKAEDFLSEMVRIVKESVI